MKIFRIFERPELPEGNPWDPWYDKNSSFLVAAKNEAEARKLAAEAADNEGAEAWLLPKWSDCEEMDLSVSRVLSSDFDRA